MRLADCFMEVFAYTTALLGDIPTAPPAVATLVSDYDRLLAESEQAAAREGFPARDWDDARFAVCAWVDETILCSKWEGRDEWIGDQLQRRVYNTQRAGEEFFDRLAALPEDDWATREVYAVCLALGFKGRHYPPEHKPILDEIKRSNLRLVYGGTWTGSGLSEMEEPFPGAYQAYTGRRRRTLLPMVDRLSFLLFVVPAVVAAGLWLSYRSWLDRALDVFFGAMR